MGTTSRHSWQNGIERAALGELVPVISAALQSAVRRAVHEAPDAAALLATTHLMNGLEAATVAAAVTQARVIPELLGRLRLRANIRDVALLAGPALTPAEFLDPERAIAVEPAKALEYFRALAPSRRVPLPDGWLDNHRRQAFELAKITDASALYRVHEIITEQITSAMITPRDSVTAVDEILDALGVTPRNPGRAEMIVRTNTMDAYNTGYQNEVKEDPDLVDEFPWWEYMAIEDDRLREEHAAHLTGGYDGGPYYPSSRSFFDVRDGNGFDGYQCRCSFRWIHKTEAADLGLPLSA